VLAGWDVMGYRSQGLEEELRVRGARVQTLLLGQIGELQARWSDQLGLVAFSLYMLHPARSGTEQPSPALARSSCVAFRCFLV